MSNTEPPISMTTPPNGYNDWLYKLKKRINAAQQKASLAVNQEVVLLYWQIGHDILQSQKEQGWGAKVIERLANDLKIAFPDMKGFSIRNLKYMRSFAEEWIDTSIVQQLVAQIPWGHNLILLDKLNNNDSRIWYAQKTIEHGWSRNILAMQIESRLMERQGSAINNFENTLPNSQSDLARESLKDPYIFDFLRLGEDTQEREIEKALVNHVTDFLLELGAGFAFVGKQVHIEVGGDDFFIDLLFYHLKLRCYMVIELKAGDFKPEHLGQLGFYLTAVDRQLKDPLDKPTIGLLLCKSKNKIVAEYALADKNQPMGIAEYKLESALPEQLKTSLPTIEQIERELESERGKQ